MRLNLGCGDDIRPDYVNVDFRQTSPVTQVVDLSKFPWPWADGSVDEVMMLDFVEHFPISRTAAILSESYRILRKGGMVRIQVPDMDILGRVLSGRHDVQCNRCGVFFGSKMTCIGCNQSRDELESAAIGRIYGGQDYAGNFHMAGFTKRSMYLLLEQHGFSGSRLHEQMHQEANWNFLIAARKL